MEREFPIVTLTSDSGIKDYFVSAVKATILSKIREVHLVDISHDVSPFHTMEGAFIFRNAMKHFPAETVHIVDIDSNLHSNRMPLIARFRDQYIILPDNGMLSLIVEHRDPQELWSLLRRGPLQLNPMFMGLLYADMASHLAQGGPLSIIAERQDDWIKKTYFKTTLSDDAKTLTARIIYIDRFGNLCVNLKYEYFESTRRERGFKIAHAGNGLRRKFTFFDSKHLSAESLSKLSKVYSSVKEGDFTIVHNSTGYIEIALNRYDNSLNSGAAEMLRASYGDKIEFIFHDTTNRQA